MSALLLSQGDHRVVGMAAALRLIITLVAIWLGLAETPGMVALAWVIGEGGAMLWMLSVALSRLRWPALQMAGLSLSWLFGRVKAGAIGQLIWGT